MIQFRPGGNSMSPKLESGDLCTVSPVDTGLIKAINGTGCQKGNNRGRIKRCVSANAIYGRLEQVKA